MEKVYFDELYYLSEQINKRKLQEYKMQLAIVQNPHVKDPKALWNALKAQDTDRNEVFDSAGFETLKMKLTQSPTIVVK